MTDLIVDYSWARPDLAALNRLGYRGMIRYLSSDTTGKNITTAEIVQAKALGWAVGLVWEQTAGRPLTGASGGAHDGRLAGQQADALGFPRSKPIYFAIDQDVTVAQFVAIGDYADAFAAASSRPAAAYGELSVVDWLLTQGHVRYGWQTSAWSGGKVSQLAHLYQRQTRTLGPVVAGSYDENVVLRPDWGQWFPAQPTPTPVSGTTTIPTSGGTMNGADVTYLFNYYQHDGKNLAQIIFDTYDMVKALGTPASSASLDTAGVAQAVVDALLPHLTTGTDPAVIAGKVADLLAARLQA